MDLWVAVSQWWATLLLLGNHKVVQAEERTAVGEPVVVVVDQKGLLGFGWTDRTAAVD